MRNSIIRQMADGTFTASVYENGECIAEHSDFMSEAKANEYTKRYIKEEAQETTNNDNTNEEKQTMNTNTKKISFEIRQIDALNYGEDEGWIWNTSYNMGEMVTKAKDEKKAFTAWMKRHMGISFKLNRTLIEYDGDVYTIIDRKTKEPLFIAIPNY